MIERETVRRLYGHTNAINKIVMTMDQRSIISGSDDGTIRLWDLRGNRLRQIFYIDDVVGDLALSSSGTSVAFSSGNTLKLRMSCTAGTLDRSLYSHDDYIYTLAFSPDNTRLASGSCDKSVRLCDALTGQILQTLVHDEWVRTIAFSPDSDYLVSGSDDDTIQVWNTLTGEPGLLFEGHRDWIRAVSVLPNSQHVVSGSDDRTIQIWDLDTGKVGRVITHTDWITSVALSSTGRHLVSGSRDTTVQLYDTANGKLPQVYRGHSGTVQTIALSPDDRLILSGGDDSMICIWDVRRDSALRRFTNKQTSSLSTYLERKQQLAAIQEETKFLDTIECIK